LEKKPTYKPLILIGAARSGTKILRDTLAKHTEIDVVPYDINYIWRIGNSECEDDVLDPDKTDLESLVKIKKKISKFSNGNLFLIEKTVSNAIRIPFVLKVFPDAKFIHLVRDGRDVVGSVIRQWGERREISYFLKKIIHFPIIESYVYLKQYIRNWFKIMFSGKTDNTYIWGVRYKGFMSDLAGKEKIEVCALQWKHCVEKSLQDLDALDDERIIKVKYEEFVMNPQKETDRIFEFIGLNGLNKSDLIGISNENISTYKNHLNQNEIDRTMAIIEPLLRKLNYLN
jgi:hypothetical protein